MTKRLRNLRRLDAARWTDGKKVYQLFEPGGILIPSRLLTTDSDGRIISAQSSDLSFLGSNYQVKVTDNGDGSLTLSFENPTRLGDLSGGNYSKFDTDGSLVFVGNAALAHGHMYAKNTSIVITVSATNTPYEVTSGVSSGLVKNFTFGGGHYLKAAIAGKYEAKYNIAANVGTAGTEIECGVMIGGTEVTADGGAHATCGAVGFSENMSGSTILDLAVNDEVSLYVRNHTNTSNITIAHLNLTLMQIGGT